MTTIDDLETTIIDLPLRRLQQFTAMGARHQSAVLVVLRTDDGLTGIGEAVTPCGPWWSGDSVESIAATIDTYLEPVVVGTRPADLQRTLLAMDRVVYNASFAKAAIEMALFDLLGKALGCGVSTLLGGAVRDRLPLNWPLATGDVGRDADEGAEMRTRGLASGFKVKMGALAPDADLARLEALAQRLNGAAPLRVDPNEAWSEVTAASAIPRLEAVGVDLIEQPVARWNVDAMARLTDRARVGVMADEGVRTPPDMMETAKRRAASVVSLKLMKSGGLLASQRIAAIAQAAGIPVYVGTFLETGVGTAATMHLAATLGELPYGGEPVGPLLMDGDVVHSPQTYAEGALWLPDGDGLGVSLDLDRVAHHRRDGRRRVYAAATWPGG